MWKCLILAIELMLIASCVEIVVASAAVTAAIRGCYYAARPKYIPLCPYLASSTISTPHSCSRSLPFPLHGWSPAPNTSYTSLRHGPHSGTCSSARSSSFLCNAGCGLRWKMNSGTGLFSPPLKLWKKSRLIAGRASSWRFRAICRCLRAVFLSFFFVMIFLFPSLFPSRLLSSNL